MCYSSCKKRIACCGDCMRPFGFHFHVAFTCSDNALGCVGEGVRDLFFRLFHWKEKKITWQTTCSPLRSSIFNVRLSKLLDTHLFSCLAAVSLCLSTFRHIMANSLWVLSHGTDCDKQVILLLQNALAYSSNQLFDTYSQTNSCFPAFF